MTELEREVIRAYDAVNAALPFMGDGGLDHWLALREEAFSQILAELLENEYED
jgi:hypothetical protein